MAGPPDITDDEKFARQLQAEIEQEERPKSHSDQSLFALPSHIANSLTEDEKLANQLQEQFGYEDSSQNPFQGGPYADIPGFAEMMAEDAQIARELQAQFDNWADLDLPPQSRSVTPRPIVRLPPSPPHLIMAGKIDESDDAVAAREFASTITSVKCSICDNWLHLDPDQLTSHFSTLINDADCKDIDYLFKCAACPGNTCPGCGEAITAAGVSYGMKAENGVHATWHCDRGRLALIWFLLSGFDHVATHNKTHVTSSSKTKQSGDDHTAGLTRAKGKKKGLAGVGYSSDGHYDYFSDEYEIDEAFAPPPPMPPSANPFAQPSPKWSSESFIPPHSHPPLPVSMQAPTPSYVPLPDLYSTQPQSPTQPPMWTGSWPPSAHSMYPQPPATSMYPAAPHPPQPSKRYKRKMKVAKPAPVDPDDGVTTYTMSLLAAILPHPTEQLVPTKFDHAPPKTLPGILRRSSILDKAAELLHNDSLDNATKRFKLYDSLIAFMRVLNGSDANMRSILHQSRRINKAGHDLLRVSLGEPTRVEGEQIDTAKSLASSMENLVSQSKRMLSVMQASGDTLESEEDQQMLLLCTLLSDCAAQIVQDAQFHSNLQNTETALQDENEWQKKLLVLPVADSTILEQHYYAKAADDLLDANPPRRRMAQIFKELVSLETDLPAGIFIRYGETRPDVMKIVIIGPQGTPYENGMFEFDLFCPLEYPTVPPQMQIKTTGGGSVGFNPNLYSDGKVCLSLLGTWQGETWKSGESTLLQVFVSIQAMIFNEEPWCNEPGRETHHGSEQCKIYNRSLYPSVVKYAMIEWIEGKRSKSPKSSCKSSGRRLGEAGDDLKGKIYGEDIWADVTEKHFEVNEKETVKTVCAWVNDKPVLRKSKGKGKQYPSAGHWTAVNGSPFKGPGRTIAVVDDAAGPSQTSVAKFEPSKLKQTGGLVSKLKELLKELQSNSKQRGSFYPDEDWDSEVEDLVSGNQ
jgi:ubiquitin-protein ligase